MLYLQKADPEPGSWSHSRQDVRHGLFLGSVIFTSPPPVKVQEDTDAVSNFTLAESQRGGTLAPDTQHGTLLGHVTARLCACRGQPGNPTGPGVLGSLGGDPCTR